MKMNHPIIRERFQSMVCGCDFATVGNLSIYIFNYTPVWGELSGKKYTKNSDEQRTTTHWPIIRWQLRAC